ncbi:MAG: SDR family NAD(P)-dependent oxidoreductase [Hyphomonas sp.]|jgi:NAD(P)-dependent dehydrogenase (short-subunit alcohol dehydrogenase family)|uniref:SDR family NAD(P)-dependent oxidoreductase n=1 Tax=Hyphomonas sp. TaxID=87 RepID=UPI00181598FC|nr:SDR family NAD(P)-dependent oxidoreductase [Hyphomonas sp.]MBA3069284.1 SDR family NAD(P)-dependent oxidoreductase [Hyphomonas sp.]MBU4063665.1 SDR family NAD(P)-dependent oxidoreductase [Alphaproteobacteria bacterium]MBU4164374.1 SDR family NAD(P)-dependent oxidoreductase [Alphaproteobacteria bacterium]MBU4568288.1 SDR family NAD(P)-dependent oxidoreductase [Alphaproteobacteria bacterium]
MGVLDGKVVLVTGGGNGIGKECALLAAREGAKVVVNDLGGSLKGDEEGSAGPAEAVAAEIRKAGGEAVSNSESVTDYTAVAGMVTQALDTYGRLDAIINPAGILRDGMFHKMSEADWKGVIDVHLHGSFNVTRAAIEYFRENEHGSFVLFTSTSGLIGNIGQANYAAAKLGIAGLSRVVAMEGAAKNVRSNIIAPFAWTRMIASIPVKDEASAKRVERMKNGMRADQVAQLGVALCADTAAHVSGQIFGVRGNEVILFDQPRPVKSLARLEGWTPDTLIEHCFPAMNGSFFSLGASASVFPYDPV